MSAAGENPGVNDALTARAEVIASNDPTAPDAQASASRTAPIEPASVGMVLRESREKLGLSSTDIATKLRMGLKQVTALENSDYATLPTGTFLRGFVRNYAKAVALNPDEVLALLETTHSGAAAVKASSVVVPSQQNIKVPVPGGELATPNGRAIVIGIVFLLLLAAVWYWWEYVFPNRNEGGRATVVSTHSIAMPKTAVSVQAGTQEPASPPVEASPVSGDAASQNPSPETPASPPANNSTVRIESVQAPVVPAIAHEAEAVAARKSVVAAQGASAALGFTFSGESWVEIVDGTGKTILSRRFKSGDAEEVTGRAPFSVVIGNASSTRMAFNGREFDLVPHTRGAVARIVVK